MEVNRSLAWVLSKGTFMIASALIKPNQVQNLKTNSLERCIFTQQKKERSPDIFVV